MKASELMRKLIKTGKFTFKEGKKHTKVYLEGKLITEIPRHEAKEIPPGTLKSIVQKTGIEL